MPDAKIPTNDLRPKKKGPSEFLTVAVFKVLTDEDRSSFTAVHDLIANTLSGVGLNAEIRIWDMNHRDLSFEVRDDRLYVTSR